MDCGWTGTCITAAHRLAKLLIMTCWQIRKTLLWRVSKHGHLFEDSQSLARLAVSVWSPVNSHTVSHTCTWVLYFSYPVVCHTLLHWPGMICLWRLCHHNQVQHSENTFVWTCLPTLHRLDCSFFWLHDDDCTII